MHNSIGYTVLHVACSQKNYGEILLELISHRAKCEHMGLEFISWLNEKTLPLGSGYRASNGLIAS